MDRQMDRRMDKACWTLTQLKKNLRFLNRFLCASLDWLVGWSWRKVERCANLQIASTTVATDWWGWQSLIWGLKCIIWGLRGLIRSLGGFFSCRHKLYQWRCRSACLSIHQSVGLLVQGHQVEKWDNKCFRCNLCMFVCVGWGLGCGWGLDAPAHLSTMISWPRITCFSPKASGAEKLDLSSSDLQCKRPDLGSEGPDLLSVVWEAQLGVWEDQFDAGGYVQKTLENMSRFSI